MAMFVIKKVVTQTHEVKASADGKSIGQLIDDHLADAALGHEDVMEVALHIAPEDWATMAEQLRGAPPERLDDHGHSIEASRATKARAKY